MNANATIKHLEEFSGFELTQMCDLVYNQCRNEVYLWECVSKNTAIELHNMLTTYRTSAKYSSVVLEPNKYHTRYVPIFYITKDPGTPIANFLLAHMYGMFTARATLPQNVRLVDLKSNSMRMKYISGSDKKVDQYYAKQLTNINRSYPYPLYNYFAAKLLFSPIHNNDKTASTKYLSEKYLIPEFAIDNFRKYLL